jgi:hypothetical protein
MTPFLQFKTGCFGDDQRTLDRLQVICGRLFLLEGVRTVAQKLGTSFVGSVMGSVVGDQLDLLLEGVRASLAAADRSS